MLIKNAFVYTPRHTFEKGSILIREGRIVPFGTPEEGEDEAAAIEAVEKFLTENV